MKPITVTVKGAPKPKKRAPSAVRGKEGIYTRHTPEPLGQYDVILGIDQSKSGTGWAIYGMNDGAWKSGVKSFSKIKHYPEMFHAFVCWLNNLLDACKGFKTLVVFEEAHHQGGASTLIGIGMVAYIMGACHNFGIECISIHTGTLKKAITGSGSAEKADMVKAACQITGEAITDDNQADAVCLAEMGRRVTTPF